MMSFLFRFWSPDRSLSLLLLSLALAIFVIHPLQEIGVVGRLPMTLVFSVFLVSGVGAVAKSGRTTTVVGALVFASLAVRWLRLWMGGGSLAVPDALFSALLCVILAGVVLAQVFREGRITWHRIQGAVAVYLLFGMAWAFAYELIALRWPGAFVAPTLAGMDPSDSLRSRFVYFSFVTLTTVGYGDITAVHPVARSVVAMEALIGQLYPAILLARLVSMELYQKHAANSERR